MSPEISLPIFLASAAFLIADEKGWVVMSIYRRCLAMGNHSSVKERLAQLGKSQNRDYENFRIAQLVFITVGLAILTGLFLTEFIVWQAYLLFAALTFAGVLLFSDRQLTQRCEKRRQQIESEFPAIVEMLTLAVGAGESPAAAMKRISQRAQGNLALEFKNVIQDVEAGESFTSALDSLSRRIDSPSLRRFVDSVIISISRGTSLVDTLTHNVNESRNQERVRLLSASGKSEVTMMIPVVFLILPISILFALYPSLTNLNLFGN